jgi:hypothetical protein
MRPQALLVAATLLSACGGLAPLRPITVADRAETIRECRALFPSGRWQATHVVEAQLPLGHQGSFLGAVSVQQPGRVFRSVLMSAEGMVLFDVTYQDGRITTHRAVAPLDAQGFGRGMTGDIRLLLLPPDGPLSEVGEAQSGHRACRWRRGDGKTVEAVLEAPNQTRILLYADDSLSREAWLLGAARQGFFPEMRLEARGRASYSLRLKLLDAKLD